MAKKVTQDFDTAKGAMPKEQHGKVPAQLMCAYVVAPALVVCRGLVVIAEPVEASPQIRLAGAIKGRVVMPGTEGEIEEITIDWVAQCPQGGG